MASSKFEKLPIQLYDVYRYACGRADLGWWQRKLMVKRAKGAWFPVCQVTARSPWEACRQARKDYPQAMRFALKLRAMPTWKEVRVGRARGKAA